MLTVSQAFENVRFFVNFFEVFVSNVSRVYFNKRTRPDITVCLNVDETAAGCTAMKHVFGNLGEKSIFHALFFKEIRPVLRTGNGLNDGPAHFLLLCDQPAESFIG
jgi:hypothetical protein